LEYAKLLGEKMRKHDVKCFLVNTGWVGGPFGVGERMNLKHTRAMVNAALDGKLDQVATKPHPVFHVGVPVACPGVPSEILDARGQWTDGAAYDRAAENLDARFRKNFEKFGEAAQEIVGAAVHAGR
jgi:phosphoenolpyruvate carboxykinase (ATP)